MQTRAEKGIRIDIVLIGVSNLESLLTSLEVLEEAPFDDGRWEADSVIPDAVGMLL